MTQLLEHDAKRLLAAEGVAVPGGALASTRAEAEATAAALRGRVAVKAQVPAGGRGKAGGVRIVDWASAGDAAASLLGREVRGFRVASLLVESAVDAERELYLGIAVDPRRRSPVLLVGAEGGVDVELATGAVAGVPWSLARGLRPAHVWRAADEAGLGAATGGALVPVAQALARVFCSQRAWVAEINPLVLSGDAEPVAVDVRIVPDRPSGLPGLDERHRRSRKLGFDYVTLDPNGEVGLITTGAGASMLLVDLLSESGLSAVNFCDVRTGTLRGDSSRLRFLLDELAAAPALQVIVVNVFAGVTDLREFIDLLLAELAATPPRAPLVVRVAGRGAEAGRARLSAAGIESVETLEELVEAAMRVSPEREAAT